MRTIAVALLLVGAAAALRAQQPDDVKRITVEEFKKLYDAGEVQVIDVRSVEAYREGHIPGALSMPLATIEHRVADLKQVKHRIVTYCT